MNRLRYVLVQPCVWRPVLVVGTIALELALLVVLWFGV